MDIWKILSIEPTTDIKIIKKAYATQLKQIDIDHHQAFIELRQAFDMAKMYVDCDLLLEFEPEKGESLKKHEVVASVIEDMNCIKNIEDDAPTALQQFLQSCAIENYEYGINEQFESTIDGIPEYEHPAVYDDVDLDELFKTVCYNLDSHLKQPNFDQSSYALFKYVVQKIQNFDLFQQIAYRDPLLKHLATHDTYYDHDPRAFLFYQLWLKYFPVEENNMNFDEQSMMQNYHFYLDMFESDEDE